MNKSIYTEYANLTEYNIKYLDGCGAKWVGQQKFSEFTPVMACVAFEKYFYQDRKDFYDGNIGYTHLPTGDAFCTL